MKDYFISGSDRGLCACL